MALASRRLGRTPLEVSPLALGSWRTLERIGPTASAALLRGAAERGINFFDDARYDDESGTAPLKTGYSEVLFGEAFRAAGLRREGNVVSNKLWWEHWPAEDAAAELDASLGRMGFDHVDLIYAVTLPDGLAVEVAVGEIAGLLAAGKARAWGVANWRAEEIEEATAVAARLGIDPPAAVQLAYNLGDRATVEDPAMEAALEASGAGLVPSNVLAGGVLTGKYGGPNDAGAGRLGGSLEGLEPLLDLAADLERQAARSGTSAAALAIAFVLEHPRTVSALVGATSIAQIEANLGALALVDRPTAS
jgi:aryl-alcohol dehydrogenase-like predicted oxidoreductase